MGNISIINGSSLKLQHKFTYLGSSVSSTVTDINTATNKGMDSYQLAIGHMESVLTNKKTQFLPSSDRVDTAIWKHYNDANKTHGKKLDGNYTRRLRAVIEQILEANIPQSSRYTVTYLPSSKLQVRRTRHAGHC